MSLPNTPHSDLESLIAAAQQGTIDEEQFFSALLDAQVFMPILDRHAIGGFRDSRAAEPLVLEAKRATAWCRSSAARIARANSCGTIRGMKGIQEAKANGLPSVEIVGANTRHLSLYKNQYNPTLVLAFMISRKNWIGRAAETVYGKVKG